MTLPRSLGRYGRIGLLRHIDRAFLRFATVGLITTTLDIGLFYILARILDVPPVPANGVSYSLGIVTSFILNRFWSFAHVQSETRIEAHALRFLASNLAGLALSTFLVAVLVHFVPAMIAKFIAVPIVFAWNYGLARFWVFR